MSEMGGKYDEPPNAVVTPKIRLEFDVWLQVDLDAFDDDVLHVDEWDWIEYSTIVDYHLYLVCFVMMVYTILQLPHELSLLLVLQVVVRSLVNDVEM